MQIQIEKKNHFKCIQQKTNYKQKIFATYFKAELYNSQ